MALETAVGTISTAEDLLGTTIANSTYFLTFSGEAAVAQALNRVHFGALPPPANGSDEYTIAELSYLRPFVVVFVSPTDTIRYSRTASGNRYDANGTVIAWFERDVPDGMNYAEAERSWNNTIGKILKQTTETDPFDGVLDQADVADRITVNRCTVRELYRAPEEDISSNGDYQRAVVEFEWGPIA